MAQTPADLPAYTQAPRPPRSGRLPSWLIVGGLLVVAAGLLPMAIAAKARVSLSDEPRVQPIQDMAFQPKYRPQSPSPVFADGRAMRPVVSGIVARGRADDDDHYFRGFRTAEVDGQETPVFFDGYPQQVKVTQQLLSRGQERFNIYCAACHGQDGSGTGPINSRAMELAAQKLANWTPAANLNTDIVRSRPEGHLYNTINVGIRSMPAHGPQIPVADRWAIVAWVRTLQLTQFTPASTAGAQVPSSATRPATRPATQP